MTMALTPIPLTEFPSRPSRSSPSSRSSPLPSSPDLAAQELRRSLTALLRRKLPASEVEDVAQTILCEALASRNIPRDPEELRRWLSGIARHKVADYHRRSARMCRGGSGVDLADASEAPPVDPALTTEPAAFEEREVLSNVLADAKARRDVETLQWLVREHSGERFSEIAKDSGVSAPVVRQRVSRMRRALRSRWAAALTVLVVIGAAAAGIAAYGAGSEEAIAPEPSAARAAGDTSTAAPIWVDDWIVESVTPEGSITPAQRALLDLHAKGATIHVGRDTVTIAASGQTLKRAIQKVETKDGGFKFALTPIDAKRGTPATERVSVIERFSDDRVRIAVDAGPGSLLHGRATAIIRRAGKAH